MGTESFLCWSCTIHFYFISTTVLQIVEWRLPSLEQLNKNEPPASKTNFRKLCSGRSRIPKCISPKYIILISDPSCCFLVLCRGTHHINLISNERSTPQKEATFLIMKLIRRTTRPTFSHIWSLKIHPSANFLSFKIMDWRTLMLYNCERVSRVQLSLLKSDYRVHIYFLIFWFLFLTRTYRLSQSHDDARSAAGAVQAGMEPKSIISPDLRFDISLLS